MDLNLPKSPKTLSTLVMKNLQLWLQKKKFKFKTISNSIPVPIPHINQIMNSIPSSKFQDHKNLLLTPSSNSNSSSTLEQRVWPCHFHFKKSVLSWKKNCENSKYCAMQKYNLQKKSSQNPSRCHNSITNLSFNISQKHHLSQNSHIKINLFTT